MSIVTVSISYNGTKLFGSNVVVTLPSTIVMSTTGISCINSLTIQGLQTPIFSVVSQGTSIAYVWDQAPIRKTYSYSGAAWVNNSLTTLDPEVENNPGGGDPGVETLGIETLGKKPPSGTNQGTSANIAPQGNGDGAHDPDVSDLDEP